MRILRKTTLRLGNGTISERKEPVTIAQLTDDERLVVDDWIARHGVPGPLNELTMLKFLDVDNTVYLGAEGEKVAFARKMWLRGVLKESWDDWE